MLRRLESTPQHSLSPPHDAQLVTVLAAKPRHRSHRVLIVVIEVNEQQHAWMVYLGSPDLGARCLGSAQLSLAASSVFSGPTTDAQAAMPLYVPSPLASLRIDES